MVDDEIERLLPPAMARDVKWMIKERVDMNVQSLADMLEFVENNPQVLRYNELQARNSRGLMILRSGQMTITFYGNRRYNICGYHVGGNLKARDFGLVSGD